MYARSELPYLVLFTALVMHAIKIQIIKLYTQNASNILASLQNLVLFCILCVVIRGVTKLVPEKLVIISYLEHNSLSQHVHNDAPQEWNVTEFPLETPEV